MQGSRCEKATDRDLSVGHIQMQFVAHPGFPIPFAVLLAAHIAFPRQIRQQFLQRHAGLPLQPRRFRGRRRRAVLRPSPLAARLDRRCRNRRAQRLFAAFNFRGIPRDMTDQPLFLRRCEERILQTLGQFGAANSAKARENCDSCGISRRLSQPQMRRNEMSADRRSSNCRVVLMLYTALATKDRAMARRSLAGLPTPPAQQAIIASIRIMLNSATSCRCFSVNGPNSSSSVGNKTPCSTRVNCFSSSETVSFIGRGILSVLESGFELLF